jgi:hypothetical protein
MFYNDWSESGIEGMMSDFSISEKELEGVTVIHADYTYEDYSGSAYVLFVKDGRYYEVHGSHCSCMGLEEQWEPEECTYAELAEMLRRRNADEDLIKDLQSYLDR